MMTPRNLAPPATLALFLATISTYLVQVLVGGDVVERAIGLIPARVSSLTTHTPLGGGQQVPAWLTLVTYMFPHKSWWHVTMNMAGLWFFGRAAEPLMGTRRFLFAYLASGVVTGLVIVILGPHWTKPAAGASGAICGVLGASLALRLPCWPIRDRRNLAVLAIESATLLGVGAWLLGRTTPLVPDRMSALMWHLIPFSAGWIWPRVGRQFALGGRADRLRQREGATRL
jgi:membrane associated rhomboid family serine protease